MKGKGKEKKVWGKGKGKVRAKNQPPSGLGGVEEGDGDLIQEIRRQVLKQTAGVDGDCRHLYEKWRTELETNQVSRKLTGNLCLFKKLKCLFLPKYLFKNFGFNKNEKYRYVVCSEKNQNYAKLFFDC